MAGSSSVLAQLTTPPSPLYQLGHFLPGAELLRFVRGLFCEMAPQNFWTFKSHVLSPQMVQKLLVHGQHHQQFSVTGKSQPAQGAKEHARITGIWNSNSTTLKTICLLTGRLGGGGGGSDDSVTDSTYNSSDCRRAVTV